MSSEFNPEILEALLPILKGRNEGFVPLAQTELTGSVASMDFQDLSQDFAHLFILGMYRSDRSTGSPTVDGVQVRFNNDSGSNYDWQLPTWSGSSDTHSVQRADTSAPIALAEGSTARANTAGSGFTFIPFYTDTTWETKLLSWTGMNRALAADSDLYTRIFNCTWRSTSAITRVTILPSVGPNWVAGTRVQIFGLGQA